MRKVFTIVFATLIMCCLFSIVTLAVDINGVDYNIANKTDLLALEERLTLDRMAAMGIADYKNKYVLNTQYYKELCGFDKLSTKIHLLKDNLRLHPMLEKYNLFDYLFTKSLNFKIMRTLWNKYERFLYSIDSVRVNYKKIYTYSDNDSINGLLYLQGYNGDIIYFDESKKELFGWE